MDNIRYKVRLNSCEKIEELLQEIYDQACRQLNEIQNELNKLVKNGLIEIDLDEIKLTPKGIDLANIVWENFI